MEVFRSALLNRIAKSVAFKYTKIGAAHYPYNVEPIQLSYLVQRIEETRHLAGNIVEIGVARGMTTRFLVEHIRLQGLGSTLRYYAIDTFESFIKADLDHEVRHRGKRLAELKGYDYNDFEAWKRHFSDFPFLEAIKSDCTVVNYQKLAPLKLVFLDVDLYMPTKKTLSMIYDLVLDGGSIVVDDVEDKKNYDGAYQAYMEFVAAKELPPLIIGNKCGVILKGQTTSLPTHA